MKRIILLLIATTLFLFSDNNTTLNLFENIIQSNADSDTDNLTAKYNAKIKDILTLGQEINVNLPNHSVAVKIKRINEKSDTRYSYSARSEDNKTTLLLVQVNSEILGSVTTNNLSYKFSSTPDNKLLITENNFDSFVEDDDNRTDTIETNTSLVPQDTNASDSIDNDSIITYTVIVAYTNEFYKEMEYNNAKVQSYMDKLELETNEGYINSGVNLRVKIVHFYKTSYVDSEDIFTDRENFMDTSKSYSQEIRTLRDKYYADIMVLLVGDKGYYYCGIANIYANVNNAFAVIRNSCGIGYFSFGHEIGHVFGARHIYYRDQHDTPFSFGHGYCSPDASWRTIMAYGCQNHAKPRKLQWSNPNISIGGLATGTEDLEYNAKVLNIRAKAVSEFRVEPKQPNKPNDFTWMIPVIYYPMLLAQ